jgi:hypothetical protein
MKIINLLENKQLLKEYTILSKSNIFLLNTMI